MYILFKWKIDGTGCMQIYNCCDKYANSKGCTKHKNGALIYDCCNMNVNDVYNVNYGGCKGFYDCCPDTIFKIHSNSQSNLQYKPTGCITRFCCTVCGDTWNNGGQDGKHTKNCTKCGYEWPCCGKKGKIKTGKDGPYSEELKCFSFCNSCGNEWGKSQGCHLESEHEIVARTE